VSEPDPKRRIAFDECAFAWRLADGTFETLPMPPEWKYDARGAQIVSSRVDREIWEKPVYSADARYPTHDEKMEPIRAETQRRANPNPE